jgi:hypothetical protein
MLSAIERERLMNRDSKDMDSQTRASNDARMRRKLATWLKEDLEDVRLILNELPEDQLKRVFKSLKDEQVAVLFDLSEKLMDNLGYHGIEGAWQNRASWCVTKEGNPMPVTERDIKQSLIVAEHARALKKHRTGDKIIAFQYVPESEKWDWKMLEKNRLIVQDNDPAVTIANIVRTRDIATYPNWTPENFTVMDEVEAILKSIQKRAAPTDL